MQGMQQPGMQGMNNGMQSMNAGMQGMNGGMQGMNGGMQGMNAGMQGMNGGMQGMNGGMQGMNGGMQGMNAGMQGMNGGMQGMNAGMQGMNGGMQGMNGGMQGMNGGMQGMNGGMQGMNAGMQGMQRPAFGVSQGVANNLQTPAPSNMMMGQQTTQLPAMNSFGLMGRSNNQGGVTVTTVGIASRAANGGFRTGDDIRAVDGIQVSQPAEVNKILSGKDPRERITVLILRDGNMAVLKL